MRVWKIELNSMHGVIHAEQFFSSERESIYPSSGGGVVAGRRAESIIPQSSSSDRRQADGKETSPKESNFPLPVI